MAANHNSHLDTLVLMALVPLHQIDRVRPVGAREYFHRNGLCRWLSNHLLGLIPISRGQRCHRGVLEPCGEALAKGDTLLLFPEGSRGRPEELGCLKAGVAQLSMQHPTVDVTPVWMRGCGRALPKGEALLVPSFCDIVVGERMPKVEGRDGRTARKEWMGELEERFLSLASELPENGWS